MGDRDGRYLTQPIDEEGNFNAVGAEDLINDIKLNEAGLSPAVVSIIGPQISGDRDGRYLTQLIDEDGNFNADGAKDLINDMNEAGVSPVVVSIIGPQISGKSTLLNHLFGTNFKEMDALKGRSATTKGLWMARSADTPHIVMDLEGIDGSQRPQDDSAFEKRLALLATAVSDIVLVNMWSYDNFGEENATKSLLWTFSVVFTSIFHPRKTTTLMFVIRDHDETETPFRDLESQIIKYVQQILLRCNHETEVGKGTPSQNFKVEVVALPSYRYKREQFQTKVGNLRKKLSRGRTGDHSVVDRFSSAQTMWEDINDTKVTETLSQDLVVQKCSQFQSKLSSDEKDMKQPGAALDFGKKIRKDLEASLSEFDLETSFIHEPVRRKWLEELKSRLLENQPSFEDLLERMRSATLEEFKTAFEKKKNDTKGDSTATSQCIDFYLRTFDQNSRELVDIFGESRDSDTYTSELRKKFESYIKAQEEQAAAKHAEYVEKLKEYTDKDKEELSQALTKKVKDIVDKEAGKNSWSKIRSLIDADARSFADSLSEKLDVDEQTKKQANEDTYMEFKNYGRGEVERTIRLEAADHRSVLLHLKYRFLTSLFLQPPKKNVEEMGRIAYSEALEFLSFMEAIRLDDNDANIVEQEPKDAPVPSSKALINPGDYADLRRKFREYAESMIRDKITKVAQDSQKSKILKKWGRDRS